MAANLLWKRVRSLIESDGPVPWDPLAEAAAAANRQIEEALRLEPGSEAARRLQVRLARVARLYKLWRRAPELLELVRIDEPTPPGGAPTRSHGAWVLFSPKAMDGAKAVTAPSPEDARSHLVAAVAYSRRCTALVSTPEHARSELLQEAARALAHATAAVRAPQRTVGALRMLHSIVMFCQQYDLKEAAGGEDLPTLLDSVVSDLHDEASSSRNLSPTALSVVRTLVVRHHLYETGDLARGVALGEEYAVRLRARPDPAPQGDRTQRLLFAEDWVGFIGHLCLFDYYIKAKLLGAMAWDELVIAVLPHMRVANRALLDRWRPWIRIVSDRADLDRLRPGLQREIVGTTMHLDGREWYWAAACAEVQARWEQDGREPLLQLTNEDHERARPLLARLGMPPDRMHVCVHARESGYHKESGINSQAHRNADILSFVPAIRFLVDQGFTVIRMGDPTMRPLPPMDGVIDYCHHPARDPWLDIYLVASAQFFVGCTSGLVMVAHVFGTPTALSHFVPPCARPYTKRDVFLPRLYWSEQEGRVLSFEESLTPPLATTFYYDRIRSRGIRALDPTDDEIVALAAEIYERWRGTVSYTPDDDRRQARYNALNSRVPWFGSNGRVGREFLRSHADLLGPNSL